MKKLSFLALFTFCHSIAAFSQTAKKADYATMRKAEKISLSLTGLPLSKERRLEIYNGTLSIKDLADKLSKGPEFIEHYSAYWNKVLGIQASINPLLLQIAAKGGTVDVIASKGRSTQDRIGNLDDNWANATSEGLDNTLKDRSFDESGNLRVPVIRIKPCKDSDGGYFPLIYWKRDFTYSQHAKDAWQNGYIQSGGLTAPKTPVRAGTSAAWKRMYEFLKSGDDLDCDQPVKVKPWWDPETKLLGFYTSGYRAAPGVLKHCGNDVSLPRCDLKDDPRNDPYMNDVARAISFEASYLIAHTVAENRPFSEILTSESSIYTGIYGSFMARMGKDFWSNFPGSKIADANHKIFTSPSPIDASHYWIKRGPLHAGVLTTPIYHLVTNGRKAKANRAFESFLCEKFAVPEGILPDPKDENPDLTKRRYCSACHKTLEPMAAFFNKWPETGETEYIYDSRPESSDNGSFNQEGGSGAPAFAKSIVNFYRFNECSIQRAFEFINGRQMTVVEKENLLLPYVDAFKSSQLNLRSIMIQMVTAPEFLSPGGNK